MCWHCYVEAPPYDGLYHTEPVCTEPRDGHFLRMSGWFCAACHHWHPWPKPDAVWS
jgi:hypothetical protein